jgi:DNA/RNA-binding domain of Phe-tRNA-synthetase-like protein
MTGAPARHAIAPALAEELPGLRLRSLAVEARPGRSDPGVVRRLGELSGRVTGAHALALRRREVPQAFRVFFRHVGLDPDTHRTPIEQAVVDRLAHGAFRARNLVDDALLVALVETGVPVWAFDEDAVDGELELRPARPEDPGVPAGRLAVADARRALGELFGPTVPGAGVTAATRRVRLVAVGVGGVPEIHVEEALFTARSALTGG